MSELVPTSRLFAERLDREDPLASFRDEFVIVDDSPNNFWDALASGWDALKGFFAGLLVVLPLAITVWVVQWILGTLDQTLLILPAGWQPDRLLGVHIPGLGVLLALGVLLLAVQTLAQQALPQVMQAKPASAFLRCQAFDSVTSPSSVSP